ncbi:hypothetical protein [Pseudomonas amygdali]|uniref:hypothetical protein n=1 Tax=Pseudomonas amygdali TaxID=47877 RepID=UPI0012B7F9E8|nr:hypothetical protein [Pseudomonas amygdali]
MYTVKFENDSQKFSNLEVLQIPLDDCLEATLEIAYGFQKSRFGVTTKDVAPVALSITMDDHPVIMADIKVEKGGFHLEWRKPLNEQQLVGVRAWRADLVKSAESELDPVENVHIKTQIELIDVIIANGSGYSVPYRESMAIIKSVKSFAESGDLGRIVIIGEIGFWGPQRISGLTDPNAPRSNVQRISCVSQVRDALVFSVESLYPPERKKNENPAENGSSKAVPESSHSDISGEAPFEATIFFAGIDPRTGLVLNREDVQIASSKSLRKVIESCQSANPTFMKGVYKGQAPILIQIESDGKLVALADVKREPVKEGYFVKWREPLTESTLAELKSKAGQLSWGSMSSMLQEKSVSFDIQHEAVSILLKGTEFSIPHEKFMEISKEVSAELAEKGDSISPGW